MEVAGAWFSGEEGLNGGGVVGDWKKVVRGREAIIKGRKGSLS